MTGIIYKHILCAVILTLLYTSMFSNGIKLYSEVNPIVGRYFQLFCNIQTTVASTIRIKTPDGTVVGSCSRASSSFPADCIPAVGYDASLNESAGIVTLNISSLASDVNGTWTCTHNSVTGRWSASTMPEIRDDRVSVTQTITSETSTSLTVTYECINIPVYFTWFAVDNSSQQTSLDVADTAEVNSSLCMTYPGFNAYTQTYSTSSVKGLDGSYRIGVEVHYSGEVTALQSIQYFNTYFIFKGTNPNPDNDNGEGLVIGVVIGVIVVVSVSVLVVVLVVWMKKKKKKFLNNDASETSRSQSFGRIRNGTVTPHDRQQPDGHEGPQSTPKDADARHITTTGIDTLDEQKTDKKPKDKKKKKKKMKDEEQDNPAYDTEQ